MKAIRVTVLISGQGTNLQALIDASAARRIHAEIVHVISNRAGAAGLERAARAGIGTSVLPHGGFRGREEYDDALTKEVALHRPDLVVLAGFMRIVGPRMLESHGSRLINLHPSLLPLHRGTDTYRRALEAGDKQHGASVHFVSAELDGGPVISQVCIPVLPGDDPATLAARLSPREHALLVATVELFSQRSIQHANGRVLLDGKALARPLQLRDDETFEI